MDTDVIVTVDGEGEIINEYSSFPSNKQYDAMFSYRNLDKEINWVRDVIQILETNYGIKCCDHERDFKPGKEIVENITECLTRSSKTVIVLSKEYMSSGWCKHELHSSFFKSRKEGAVTVIPVVIEDCKIPEFLEPLTFIDARGNKEEWLPKLVNAITSTGDELNTKCTLPEKKTYVWKSLSFLDNANSEFTCQGSIFNTYVSNALQSQGIMVSSELYTEVINSVAATQIVKGRHCRLSWCGSICCWATVYVVCVFIGVSGLVYYFPYDDHDDDAELAAVLFWLLVPVILLSCVWLPVCICTAQKGKRQIEHVLTDINYKMIPLTVMVTIKRSLSTVTISFYCYQYKSCYDTLLERFITNASDTETNQTEAEDPQVISTEAENIENDNNLESDHLVVEEDHEDYNSPEKKDPLRMIFARFAAEYLQEYLYETLPTSDTCHTERVICLCQYIKLRWRNKYWKMTNSEKHFLDAIFSKEMLTVYDVT